MFPIGDVTQFELIIALIACIVALSTGYWRWIVAAISVPLLYFGILVRLEGGDHIGIARALFLGVYATALVGGLIWGWGVRRISGRSSLLALGLAAIPGLAFAVFALERQYVPLDCRNNGAHFSMAGDTFTIPRIDGYWHYRAKSISLTGYSWNQNEDWNTRKHHMAEFCHLTENGTLPLDVVSVRIGQRYTNTEFNLAPTAPAPPNWDWNNFPRAETYRFGSNADGAECYVRANEVAPTFSCAVWATPMPSVRIYAVSIRRAPEDVDETVRGMQRDLSQWFGTIELN
ncbi:MAG: hypothetical protein AAFU80_13775 [Pseudomonadota bacterium]